jgi:dihydroorotase-like cyclic amidohydrolase
LGTELYALHLSTPEEFALVQAAKERGVKVHSEIVGYQLFFTTEDYKKYGNKIKVSPALRSPEDQKQLWDLVRSGGIDVLASEHTPHEWELKNQSDMWKAPAGTPGVQENMPAFITKWVSQFGEDTLEECLMKLSTYSSYNPASIFGFHSKGEIAPGKDADFSILNTKDTWNVKKEDLFSKCGWSAYENMDLIGRPASTYLRGTKVYEDGTVLNQASGNLINRS